MGNLNTNFRPVMKLGRWELTMQQMKESVAMEEGAALYTDLAGELTIGTNSATNFRGILAKAIAATDADYAVAKKMKPVWVPKSLEAEAEFAVGAGTFTNEDVGKTVVLNNSVSVAVDTAGVQIRITKYTSSTRGVCVFSPAFSQT